MFTAEDNRAEFEGENPKKMNVYWLPYYCKEK